MLDMHALRIPTCASLLPFVVHILICASALATAHCFCAHCFQGFAGCNAGTLMLRRCDVSRQLVAAWWGAASDQPKYWQSFFFEQATIRALLTLRGSGSTMNCTLHHYICHHSPRSPRRLTFGISMVATRHSPLTTHSSPHNSPTKPLNDSPINPLPPLLHPVYTSVCTTSLIATQGVLNDYVLGSATYRKCIEVVPSSQLFGPHPTPHLPVTFLAAVRSSPQPSLTCYYPRSVSVHHPTPHQPATFLAAVRSSPQPTHTHTTRPTHTIGNPGSFIFHNTGINSGPSCGGQTHADGSRHGGSLLHTTA